MRNTVELLERFKNQLQRNHDYTEPKSKQREVAINGCFEDGYGRRVAVIAVSHTSIVFRRDGYDQNCEMRREKFLKEFTEVDA